MKKLNRKISTICLIVIPVLLVYLFYDGFIELEWRWSRHEEYSHGYLIPLVALFLFWQKLPIIIALDWKPAWTSLLLVILALFGWVLGELSSLYIIVHYSMILALTGLVLAVYGWTGLRVIWATIAFLVFMIPLPTFLYSSLSASLQLLSTELGVWFIRLFDISVHVSGNVIDLGVYQLQVVEACSGLTYLFPLMSFGFLIGYLYRGPIWQRCLILASTVPITILMNSFRIGVIGITVEYWGVAMAEGFLHAFEGWFVFMACLGILFAEVWILGRLFQPDKSFAALINFSYPLRADLRRVISGNRETHPTIIAVLILLILVLPLGMTVKYRSETIPDRDTFSYFPLVRHQWMGRESSIEPRILDRLDLTDYIKADYRRPGDGESVSLYIAYYQSQRKGSSIHSPRSCIPGGGWEISELTRRDLGHLEASPGLTVNRLVIAKGAYRQLVYYWFSQRGRIVTSEYLAKWYLFLDALTIGRSDGALVRIVTSIAEGEPLREADNRLQDYIQDFYPVIQDYIPAR